MTALRQHAEDYLAMRRALGFKLTTWGIKLMSFVSYLEARDATVITADAALAWATSTPRARRRSIAASAAGARLGRRRAGSTHKRWLPVTQPSRAARCSSSQPASSPRARHFHAAGPNMASTAGCPSANATYRSSRAGPMRAQAVVRCQQRAEAAHLTGSGQAHLQAGQRHARLCTTKRSVCSAGPISPGQTHDHKTLTSALAAPRTLNLACLAGVRSLTTVKGAGCSRQDCWHGASMPGSSGSTYTGRRPPAISYRDNAITVTVGGCR